MPIQIEHEGKPLTVYTEDEVTAKVTEATKGLLSAEDAERLANSKAAAARKEAETKLADLQTQLQQAQGDAAKVADLQRQITEHVAKLTTADKRLAGIKALTGAAKLSVAEADFLLTHPSMSEHDFTTEDGIKNALDAAKVSMPKLFGEAAGSNQEYGGGSTQQKNPWAKDSFNLTEQGRLMRENPTLAKTLQEQAQQ